MTTQIILLRDSEIVSPEEKAAMSKHFKVVESRMEIPADSLVIGRYSVLPFYEEQERDIKLAGSQLINSYKQHRYIADLMNWYEDLHEFTPRTWRRLEDVDEEGPYVLKGATNSRKFQWDTHMFAKDKRQAAEIYCELCNDSLIGRQDIYIRKYIPLKTYMTGLRGLPITDEWRVFIYKGKMLSYGYYWSSHVEDLPVVPYLLDAGLDLVDAVKAKVGDKCPFYVMDIARTQDDNWILIELNDGQMSGLSENDPNTLYKNLKQSLL